MAEQPLRPLFDEAGAWPRLEARLHKRPFLYSEGVGAPLVMPVRAAPWLVEKSRALVGAFHRFYRAVADAADDGPLANEPALQLGEPYARLAKLEGAREAVLLGRYDCVLEADGSLRTIELNPIGVCTIHLRAASYLARALARSNDPTLAAAARDVDAASVRKLAAVRRYADETLAHPPARPTVAVVLLPGMHRGTKLFWRRELVDRGFDVVFGPPSDVNVRDGRVRLGETKVDILWLDWAVYLGYQQTRYQQTRFVSKLGDFSQAGAASERLLGLPGLEAALRDRVVTLVSPMRSYRALSKALLAWVERPELRITDEDRTFLRAHVTRTHDHNERVRGVITPERARQEREAFVWKPCRFGGSHGVLIGRDTAPDEWARRLEESWADPEWVLQAYSPPLTDDKGATLSFGIYDFGGELGGMLVRSARQTIVSARSADIIVAVI